MTKVAVVTGGAGAIGGAIARRLEESGHRIVVVDREAEVSCDLGNVDEVRGAAKRILEEHGGVDVLVHAAAISGVGTLEDFDLERWRLVQTVNVESLMLLAHAFAPGMRERKYGRIISVASNTFWDPPGPHMLAYVASKGTVIGLTRVLAKELGADGVAIMAVAPGLTRTPISKDAPAEEFALVESLQGLKRPLVPDDVAQTVAFLATEGAIALTGQTLITDGGLVFA